MGESSKLKVAVGLGLFAMLCSSVAWAVDARTLPSGRFRFSFIYGAANSITEEFDKAGEKALITDPYAVPLSATRLGSVKLGSGKLAKDIEQLIDTLNNLGYSYDEAQRGTTNHGVVWQEPGKPKLGDALARGILDLGAEANRSQYNFALQYGVSDRFTVGAMLPYIQNEVQVRHGIVGTNTAQDIYRGLIERGTSLSPELKSALDLARNLSTEFLQEKLLLANGYAPIKNFKESGLGDLIVGGRYNYLNTARRTRNSKFINSVQAGVSVPTGKVYAPSEILAPDFGNGLWEFTGGHLVNYSPGAHVTLWNSVNYTYRAIGKRLKRVPDSEGDLFPGPETEENLDVKMGDKFWTSIGATFHLTNSISFVSGYEWWWKGSDQYAGSRGANYSLLSSNTKEYLETLELTLSVSTIDAFLAQKFWLPLTFRLSYFLPTSGRNRYFAPFYAAELAMYF